MKKVKKIALLSILVFGINVLLHSYEDYYQKVYTVKISKNDIFKAVKATENQKKKLSKIYKTNEGCFWRGFGAFIRRKSPLL